VEIEDSTDTDEKVVVRLLRCRGTDPRCDHPRSRTVLRTPGLGKTLELDDRFAAGVLSAVAKATGQKLSLKPAPAPPLYTIQLLAAREQKRADELASRINKDRSYVHKGDYVFNANCGPCNNPPEAKIEAAKLEGATLHRVFVGNYESPRDARADLAELARLGYRNLNADDITGAYAVGVRENYIRDMASVGYGRLTLEQLTELRAVGVMPSDVQRYRRAGFTQVDVDKLVQLKSLGISPEELKASQDYGP